MTLLIPELARRIRAVGKSYGNRKSSAHHPTMTIFSPSFGTPKRLDEATSAATVTPLFDFTLGTHPISTKGTTELGRSEATKRFWVCLH